MRRTRLVLPCSWVLAVVVLAGCGEVEVDTGAVKENFAERAEAAYDGEGLSRADDRAEGVVGNECFALDDEGLDAIAEEMEATPALLEAGLLQGAPSDENLDCRLLVAGSEDAALAITVATTSRTAAELADDRRSSDYPPEVLDRDADGLDADDVVGFVGTASDGEQGSDSYVEAVWVHDGLAIGFAGPGALIDQDEVYAVLPVLVQQVDRVLG